MVVLCETGQENGTPASSRVGLSSPDGPTDKVVLTVSLSLADKTTAPCPAAQTLTETALSHIPAA